MREVTIEQILVEVVNAKQRAQAASVEPENLDAVAATLAALALVGAIDSDQPTMPPYALAFRETFAEWAHQYKLETHFERFLVAALYLMEKEGKQEFTTTDIGEMYEKAYWKKPANMADVFAKSAQRLYFAPVEGRESEDGLKLWHMTGTGYDHLQSISSSKQEHSYG